MQDWIQAAVGLAVDMYSALFSKAVPANHGETPSRLASQRNYSGESCSSS